jgi:hypothetical protein
MTPEGQSLHDIIEMVYRRRIATGHRHRKGVRQAAFKRVLLKVPLCQDKSQCVVDTVAQTFREYEIGA